MRSGSIPGISGLDSPRLDEKDCWSSGKIGSADFLTNMGWPGQAGKFVKGVG